MLYSSSWRIRQHSRDPFASRSALTRLSAYVTNGMEGAFERHGRRVAANAHTTAALCMVFSALCSLGSFYFVTELRPYSLWLPQDSEFIKVRPRIS